MSHELIIKLSDPAYAVLERQATVTGTTASAVASSTLEEQLANGSTQSRQEVSAKDLQVARDRLQRFFGSINAPEAVYRDNESLEADLADEYGTTHGDR